MNGYEQTYDLLRQFFREQIEDGVERISVPGIITGREVELRGGHTVPMIVPDVRGMYNWTTQALVAAVGGEPGTPEGAEEGILIIGLRAQRALENATITDQLRAQFEAAGFPLSAEATVTPADNEWLISDGDNRYAIRREVNRLAVYRQASSVTSAPASGGNNGTGELQNFLDRVYHELSNRGLTPQERALNYAATNAFQAHQVFVQAAREGVVLDTVAIHRSPFCREGSSCWDVTLTFFDPKNRFQRAKRQYRFTIDVSEALPVSVGQVHAWSVYE